MKRETAEVDIVERLREWQNDDGSIEGLMTGAADEIERLRETLKTIAEIDINYFDISAAIVIARDALKEK